MNIELDSSAPRELSGKATRIDNDDLSLICFDEGDPNAAMPRWFFQGLGSEFSIKWSGLLHELGNGNERHLGFDPRGIGDSEGSPDSLEQVADDAAQVVRKLGIKAVQVVGHSLGGATAMLLASRYPEMTSSLVVMDSVPKYSDKARQKFAERAALILAGKGEEMFNQVVPRAFGENFRNNEPEVIQQFADGLAKQDPHVYARYSQLAAELAIEHTYTGPTLFIVGKEDPSTKPDDIRQIATAMNADFVEIPNAGHNPAIEQPGLVAKTIKKFTASIS